MSDELVDLFGKVVRVTPRQNGKNAARFREAFRAELEANPDKAPGPAALARRLGLSNTRNLNGPMSALRRELLTAAGFRKNPHTNRWEKK